MVSFKENSDLFKKSRENFWTVIGARVGGMSTKIFVSMAHVGTSHCFFKSYSKNHVYPDVKGALPDNNTAFGFSNLHMFKEKINVRAYSCRGNITVVSNQPLEEFTENRIRFRSMIQFVIDPKKIHPKTHIYFTDHSASQKLHLKDINFFSNSFPIYDFLFKQKYTMYV